MGELTAESPWLKAADRYIAAAEEARLDGEVALSLALAVEASKCVKIAKLLDALPPSGSAE
jgi:hypothetical protein